MIKDILEKNQDVRANTTKLAALREHFAGCFTSDGAFDMERFKEMLRDEVDLKSEGYSLNFLGKDYANLIASVDTTTVVVPDMEHNSKPENKHSENVYISGDNLDALKHLLKSYAGQVKCIYIDPPYNTGTDGFVYNDRFSFTSEQLQKRLSVDEDEAKRILDMTSRGSSTHSAWLMFMSPRLQLARQLLSKDGVIYISIDDNEQANLKLLCDYVFGEENFVAQFIWEKRLNRENRKEVSVRHDYILCYCKNSDSERRISQMPMTESALDNYGNPDNDPRGPWKSDPAHAQAGHGTKSQFYTLVAPNGKKHELPSGRCWLYTQPVMEEAIKDNRIWFGKDGNGVPRVKTYLYSKDRGLTPETMLFAEEVSTNENAKNDLKDLFEGVAVFETPKPVELLTNLLRMSLDSSLVLDFFSGSASLADAVMQLNSKENKEIKYILVQLPEEIAEDKEAYKAGYRTIDQIGQERIKRAAAKIKADNPLFAGDLGFKHYTLNEVPENVLDKMEEFKPEEATFGNNMLELFGRETVLATWKVRDGYGLTSEVEEVQLADYTAYQCGDHLYLLDEGLSDDAITAMVDKYGEPTSWNPHNVVLFGYNMNFGVQDALRTNLPLLNEGEKQIKINIDVRY